MGEFKCLQRSQGSLSIHCEVCSLFVCLVECSFSSSNTYNANTHVDLFSRYSPAKIDISYRLQPFIPDFIPAVGDIDAFLKVIPPKPFSEKSKISDFLGRLGLEILDEPCGNQSDPTLLHMKLRSVSTSKSSKSMPPPAISKSSKDIEKWISEVQALHANQPYPTVMHTKPMPDIDALMIEWPTKMEHIFNSVGFPNAQLNCSLTFYIDLMCGLLDIPLPPATTQTDYLLALSTIFNLYLAIKNPIE